MFGRQKVRDLTPAEVRSLTQKGDALLIDVREADEHAAERIRGALNFPLSALEPQALPEHAGLPTITHDPGAGPVIDPR